MIDIVADTVGHDLNRGMSNYMRQHRPAAADGDPAAETPQGMPDGREMADGPGPHR